MNEQRNRCFIGQNVYIAKLQKLVDVQRKIHVPISKSFESEYKLAESNKESITDQNVITHQVINGALTQMLKAGRHLPYAYGRLAFAKSCNITIRKLKEMVACVYAHPYLAAMVPNRVADPKDQDPEVNVHWFSYIDFAGESDNTVVTGKFCTVNGVPVVWGREKQSLVTTSVCESELVAANSTSKTGSQIVSAVESFGLINSDKIHEAGYTDSSGTLDISEGRTLNKRSRHIRIHELALRQKVHDYRRPGTFKLNKIDTPINPADGYTKPLDKQSLDRFCAHVDIVVLYDLIKKDDMKLELQKHENMMES